MANSKFFNADLVLSRRTKTGDKPNVVFIVSRVRGAGKTYSLTRRFLQDFFEHERKFIFLVRFSNMLGSVANGRMGAVVRDLYPQFSIQEVVDKSEAFSRIYLVRHEDEERIQHLVGYGVSINASSKIKDLSSTFYDVDYVHLDEFIPADGKYVPDEIAKVTDIMVSVQRGSDDGEHSIRYVPLILSGNAITPRNMYFYQFGLYGNVDGKTKKWSNDRVVYQRYESEAIVEEHKYGFIGALVKQDTFDYSSDWGEVDTEFDIVNKPKGWGHQYYLYTIVYNNIKYAVKYYNQVGLYYIDTNVIDDDSRMIYRCDYISGTYPLFKRTSSYKNLKLAMDSGNVRFKNSVIRDTLVYNVLN